MKAKIEEDKDNKCQKIKFIAESAGDIFMLGGVAVNMKDKAQIISLPLDGNKALSLTLKLDDVIYELNTKFGK